MFNNIFLRNSYFIYETLLALQQWIFRRMSFETRLGKNGQYMDPPQFYSLNHVNAYCNAIKIFYREKKTPMGDEMEGVL